MKILLKELLDAKTGFEELLSNKDLPVLVSYRINKLIDEINPEFEAFEKSKNELIKKYGEEKQEEGKDSIVEVKPDNLQNYFKELEDIVKEEISLKYEPFNIAAAFNADDIKKIKIGPPNQRLLEPFFTGWEEAIARME